MKKIIKNPFMWTTLILLAMVIAIGIRLFQINFIPKYEIAEHNEADKKIHFDLEAANCALPSYISAVTEDMAMQIVMFYYGDTIRADCEGTAQIVLCEENQEYVIIMQKKNSESEYRFAVDAVNGQFKNVVLFTY